MSIWQKTAFGAGGLGDNLMQNAINNISNQVLNIFLGVNPALISTAIFISRIWDAFTDPVMGSISDNTRTRFGRRRPYIMAGGIGAAVLFVLLWRFPFVSTEMGYFVWFLVMMLAFYTCYTIFSVPYNALSYEMSPDYNERTRIMAFKCVFGSIAGLLIQWQYKLTQLDCFENTLDGIRTVSLWVAGIIVLTSVLTAVVCKERDSGAKVEQQEKIKLWQSLKMTLANRTFGLLMLALIFTCLGMFMVTQMGIYINVYYVFNGDEKAAAMILGIAGTVYHVSGGILASPVVSWVASRIGKKKTLMGGLALATLGCLAKYVTYTPENPYLQLVSLAMMAPGLSCLWILSSSMVADICDQDELQHGVRREGMFGAVYGYVMKIGVSVGLLLTGFLLNATGFDASLGSNQAPETILSLRVLFTAIPAAGLLLAMALIARFPITPERAAEIRRQLEERKIHQGE